MIDNALGVITSIVIVAGVTAALLPGRQTPAVIRESGTALAKVLGVATGQKS